ncbi:MAG: ATP-binding cassette domain-containing protein [Alphaproteobacteria bacterium]
MSMIPAKETERPGEDMRPSAEIVAMSRPTRGFARIQSLDSSTLTEDVGEDDAVKLDFQTDPITVAATGGPPPPPPPEATVPRDEFLDRTKVPLSRALEWVAEAWFNYQLKERQLHPGALAPETAEIIAHGLGISLKAENRNLTRLRKDHFPCLALDREGYAYLLLANAGRDGFICRTDEGDKTVEINRLKKTFSGTIFFLRPLAASEHGDEASGSNADAPVDSIVKFLSIEMLKRRPWTLGQLALAALVSNSLLVLLPIFTMAVYDRVIPHLAFDTLWALSIGMGLALAADLALRHVKLRLIDSLAAEISHVAQIRFFRHLVFGSMVGLPRTSAAVTPAIRDLEGYCQLIPLSFVSLAIDLPFVIVTTILLASIAGSVAIVPIAGTIFIGLIFFIAHMAGRSHLQPYLGQMRAQSNMVTETIEGLETVKTSTAETVVLNRWERLADSSAFASHAARLANGMAQHWASTISQLMTIGALIFGVYEISINAMTVGALSAATMLIGRLIGPIMQMTVQIQRLLQARKTLEPIRMVFNSDLERAGDGDAALSVAIDGHFDFVDVGHKYQDSQLPSLSNITLNIRPGERVGIIGRIGCGKSTLLRLMVRLLEPSSGAIRLDGRDLRQASPRELRRRFSYVSQDATLFDDTLTANLLLGHEKSDPKVIEEAVTISGVAGFAGRSPEGYGMRVGPRGERLSGGERQAVGLARALIGNPAMLILDEPTAAMDNTTERHVINGLSKWLGNRTLIVATHRAAMLDLVDRVILMHEGKIIADGPKDQVLKKLQAS